MKPAPTASSSSLRNRVLSVLLLLAVLGLLFWRSFLPDFVHFSNDGPLGQMASAQLSNFPGNFAGGWSDLTDVGGSLGTTSPTLSILIGWLFGPVGFAKFSAPFALFILGLGAWSFFRCLKFTPVAATLGALAAMLNSTFFASACWGVASQEIAMGMDFFALALVVANTAETPAHVRWTRLALAGLCVGINVMEAADIGALFSMFIAAFVFFKSLADAATVRVVRCVRGVSRVAVVAVFAGFIAFQTVLSLVGTTSRRRRHGAGRRDQGGALGLGHAMEPAQKRNLGLIVPGLFGYKMDTPNNMMPQLQRRLSRRRLLGRRRARSGD